MSIAVGIDLGTTYSCVGIFQNGGIEMIPNEIGEYTTPSYLHLESDGYPVVGKAAKTQMNLDPAAVLYDVKRLIGRRFTDPVVQHDMNFWPFQVINENNTPKLLVNDKSYHPEEISAKILRALKINAEKYLRQPVTKAVITVPAYFNNGQRQATKDAGEIAGLEVLRIVNEPTAAAIAYCHFHPTQVNQKVLVFDLGGGTFDVAVLSITDGNIQILTVGGDTHLGGEDFDRSIADYCIEEFKRLYSIDLSQGKYSSNEMKRRKSMKILRRLKIHCEEQKCSLAAARQVTISLDAAHEDLDLNVPITRETFNKLNQPLFDRCMEIVDSTLKQGNLTQADIDEVILVGGSSKIPKIQQMITEYFGGRQPSLVMKGDLAVAQGAALLAAISDKSDESKGLPNLNINFRDVVPLPIGISAFLPNSDRRIFSAVIEKNLSVPCSRTRKFETRTDNQRIVVRIFEGVEEDPDKNYFLGEFNATNLPDESPKGEPYWVHMFVDTEGILEVTISYKNTGLKDKYKMEAKKGRLGRDEVERLKLENQKTFKPD